MDELEVEVRRRWTPVLIAILVVTGGTLINVLLWTQTGIEGDLTDEFVNVRGNMGFVRWSRDSLMDETDPNSLFVVVNERIVGRFEFETRSYRTLVSAGIRDLAQRAWINADHAEGTYHVNCYPPGDLDPNAEPDLTYLDRDGNGLPDRKVDWGRGASFDAAGPVDWEPLNPPPKEEGH